MSRATRARRRRSGGTLETGLGLAALGIFLLMLPVFMNSPLQQSALEPLEPMGWIMLLVGVAVCGWCFRPLSRQAAQSESLGWLSRSASRQPSRVTPDRKTSGARSESRRTRKKRQATEPADDAERRAALKAAVKANVARMSVSLGDMSADRTDSAPAASDTGFADTVLALPRSAHHSRLDRTDNDRTDAAPVPFASAEGSGLWTDAGSDAHATPDTSTAASGTDEFAPFRETPPAIWNARVFQLIEWRRFEAVIEALFAQAGFKTRPQKHAEAQGTDGGVDIWLYSRHARRAVSVVQCKHWQGRPVSATELKRFFNVMNAHQLKRGTYATTSTFTPDARAFAQEHGIHAMDGAALLDLIQRRTPEQQAALLETAFEGEYWRPTCSSCGVKLIQRGSAENGSLFWGCSNFPQCRMRMPIAA